MRPKRLGSCSGLIVLAGLLACETEPAPEIEPALEPAPAPATSAPAPAAPGTTLDVATTPYGPHLTDAEGRALYLLEEDPRGSSTCYEACAQAWPPFTVPQGTPTAVDASIQSEMIGTHTRRDGTVQVTYNGHPLYYYSRDPAPGQVTGHDHTDEWGEWYLVMPEGSALKGN